MTEKELELVHRFKSLLEMKVRLHSLIVFGSRARGDSDPESDLDVLVIIDEEESPQISEYVSDTAWEAGLGSGIYVSPILMSRERWENGLERVSLLGRAVEREGILV